MQKQASSRKRARAAEPDCAWLAAGFQSKATSETKSSTCCVDAVQSRNHHLRRSRLDRVTPDSGSWLN
jgi:hypothetical protein